MSWSAPKGGVTWRELSSKVVEDYPQWILTGRGDKSLLTRKGIAWRIQQVGWEKTSSTGRLYYRDESLTVPLEGSLGVLGMLREDVTDDGSAQDHLVPHEQQSELVLRHWMDHPVAQRINDFPDSELVSMLEGYWDRRLVDGAQPWWWSVSGWRIVCARPEALEVAREALTDARARAATGRRVEQGFWEKQLNFFETLIRVLEVDDRLAALTFLDAERRRGLAARGIDGADVADVLRAVER
jgi:hypothetical protein